MGSERILKNGKIIKYKSSERVLEQTRLYQQKPETRLLRIANGRRRLENPYIKFDSTVTSRFKNKIKSHLSGRRPDTTPESPFYYLPYTVTDVIRHIESQFDPEMSWENWGDNDEDSWHLEHIFPKSGAAYNSYLHPNFYFIWQMSNLQPLYHSENRSKLCLDENGKKYMYRDNEEPKPEAIRIMNELRSSRATPYFRQCSLF